jgi:integrase
MSGEGSVFRRSSDGAWIAQISSGGRGHRSYDSRSARTKAEARRRLEEMKADRRAGLDLSRLSLGAYLRRWLDETAGPTVSPNTLRGYRDALIHLEPINAIPLNRLTAEDIEACCNRMWTHRVGASAQHPAAAKTVRNVQVMLRRALGQAELRGHVRRNPAKLVTLRRVPRFPVEALTPERAGQILAAIAGDRLEAAYALAFAGLRLSEILGLAHSDVDLTTGTISIRHQISGSGRKALLVDTKTAASAATIPLPQFVIQRLQTHLMTQVGLRPVVPFGDALVFVTEQGFAISGSWFTKHFQALLSRAGLPTMRLHDMRHGAASLLVDAGAHPRVAQELLRHAPGSRVTMERYAHVTAGQERLAADLLDRAVTGLATSASESVTESVTDRVDGVVRGRPASPRETDLIGENGSGGRIRTYDHAVNSRPLYH